MHRFRKRSDARRVPIPETSPRITDTQELLPSLPPASDFRTSLILPDLTRRFSVLRNSSGEPIGLDELKSKFAEQRARGSQNQVTEEEEDMILEALGRLHGRKPRSQRQPSGYESSEGRANAADGEDDDADPMRQSVRSSNSAATPSLHGATSSTSLSSTKGSQTSRRMSNNLFGSGKFRDQAYFLRTGNGGRRSGRGTGTIAQSDSTMSMSTVGSGRADNSTSIYSDSLRPVTPEGSTYTFSGSAPSSPGSSALSKDRSSRSTAGEPSDYASSSLSKRLSKALSPDGLRRASLALDQAIRELEEEGDDEIVMERSPIAHAVQRDMNGSLAALTTALEPESSSPLPSPGDYEAGTALSSDDPVIPDEAQRTSPYPASRTTSPTPRLPGYIPGMPRPMTPREATFDSEDLTPSATPRATSPRLPGLNTQSSPLIPQSFASGIHRSNSSASASYQATRPVSPAQVSTPPLFFNRSMNGRYTPEDRQRSASKPSSPTTDVPESPVTSRRRPMSPLSGPAYQPLASPSSRPSSRPGTPSNVTWNTTVSPNGTPQKAHGRNGSSVSGHSRSGSTTSINDQGTEALERSKSTSRSLRSPALPDSPWVDNGHTGTFTIAQPEYRPPSAMSGMDLGSPVQIVNRILRSPTPTHNGTRSPISPTFQDFGAINGDSASPSRRSSKQTQHASSNSFSLGSNALLFSPIANSSRSSLESAGSSYHTWDEEHKKDRLAGLLDRLDSDSTPWHDISPDKSGPSTAGTSPYDSLEPEDAVRREIGLTKSDFVTIQDKLVTAALTKAATPETRTRAGSIRKRRPSTSQSNYSFAGESRAVNSTPQPQPQPADNSSRPTTSDSVAKANALLNAVVDSIESPSARHAENLEPEESNLAVPAPADTEQSSPMRRNRALADALFGVEDQDRPLSPPVSTKPPQISILPDLSEPERNEEEPILPVLSPTRPLQTPKRSDSLRHAKTNTPTPPANVMPKAPLSPLSPTTGMNPSELALEVQRRAEAATAALRKSPSIPKIAEGSGTLPRKRISPNKISSPTLVSASTSVDAIPLRSPTASPSPLPPLTQPTSKIGSRFKKLRGTIRAKQHVPNGEEITPYPLDLRSPTSGPPSGSSPSLALRSDPVPMSVGHAEPTRLKPPPAPLPSPPASATPGLKGFMARFRKQRVAPEPLVPPTTRHAPGPSSATSAKSVGSSGSSPDQPYGPMPHSAPALQTMFRSPTPAGPTLPPSQSPTPRPPQESFAAQPSSHAQTNEALKQLFDAATNLGLDQAALNDLIARSPSTSSRSTAWTRLTRTTSPNESRKSQVPVIRGRATPDSARSPASEGRPSFDGYSPRPSTETRPPVRKSQESPQRPRQQQQDAVQNQNTVVRRTIIFPSDSRASGVDLSALMRKQSSSRRRASVGSKSSVHDRVPTPPPPHRAGGRRFSTDSSSPPVPQLPPSFSFQAEGSLAVPNSVEKSSSAYDSLYEMYSGEGKGQMLSTESPGAGSSQGQREAIPEPGPALEVIEMANGETIWSIVNGLRDDDGESYYGDRASFYSEYSVKDTNENMKLFFKEHERKSSKGSTSSFLSRKKPQQPKGTARPETKVFFSSSAQIGRLIENLSRGMDAGSFNIMPGQGGRSQGPVGHSTSSSLGSEADMRWTVEERLEHMLGSMGAT